MGAEHKLDLTSDVTHLIVGDTDTPKYKYVAKEREDVKVLQPEWIDAVRKQWMADETIDISALESQYRVPTLAGLKICITGFDDLNFRGQLQKNVIENGGQYTGDLTKDVTHLIANVPSGKKYEYGMQWQKKIVSLRWYRDTLERGMQLEESAYHPTIPDDEQGVGAWNRLSRKPSPPAVKRQRDDSQGAEQPRKLRRTASARFSSQNDTMWSDIVSKEAQDADRPPARKLQVSRSVPDLKNEPTQNDGDRPQSANIACGFFDDKYFVLQAFSAKHAPILRNVLVSHGGTVLDTLGALRAVEHVNSDNKILLLPHQTPLEQVPSSNGLEPEFQVTSELWVEYCMCRKNYQPPKEYTLGRLLPRVRPTGFSKLVICSTGFLGIVPNHIDKIVRLLGATYEQTFKNEASVLLCNSHSGTQQTKQKVDLACRWQIPVVTESWLWTSIQDNRKAPFEAHGLPAAYRPEPRQSKNNSIKLTEQSVEQSKANLRTQYQTTVDSNADATTTPAQRLLKYNKGNTTIVPQPGMEATSHHANAGLESDIDRRQRTNANINGNSPGSQSATIATEKQPLQPLSPNSSPQRRRKDSPKPKKRLFQTFDGNHSDLENSFEPPLPDPEPVDNGRNPPEAPAISEAQSLNSEIRQLLDLKSKAKAKLSESKPSSSGPKKQLMGRALSNLSNASSTSHVRQSRAGSVDSVNTDGVGSEVGPAAGSERRPDARDESSTTTSFIGRATSKLLDGRTTSLSIMAASAAEDHEEQQQQWASNQAAAAAEPALTQLVYEDPEEAIQLREKLAAKRRQRSQLGQKDSDPKPAKPRDVTAEPSRIKDDDVYAAAGWGAGRRTRQRNTSLSKEF